MLIFFDWIPTSTWMSCGCPGPIPPAADEEVVKTIFYDHDVVGSNPCRDNRFTRASCRWSTGNCAWATEFVSWAVNSTERSLLYWEVRCTYGETLSIKGLILQYLLIYITIQQARRGGKDWWPRIHGTGMMGFKTQSGRLQIITSCGVLQRSVSTFTDR